MKTFIFFQYQWNDNEMYLFKASMAFAMRQYYLETNGEILDFTSVSNNFWSIFCADVLKTIFYSE